MKNLAQSVLIAALLLLGWMIGMAVDGTAVSAGTDQFVYLPFIIRQTNEPVPFGAVHTGEGTYYNATGAGNCSFDPSPQNLMVAALNQVD